MFFSLVLGISLFLFGSTFASAQSQNGEQPSMEEMAIQQAEKLGESLKLEDWQVFYVDSTLRNDYLAMEAELNELKAAKVSNTDLYMSVQDKWMQQIADTFRKIFNDEQWERFQKSGGAKAQKARDKRRAKEVNVNRKKR